MWKDITEQNKLEFNELATHPLQSYEWGEFRKSTGIKVIRKGLFEKDKLKQAFQLTIHPIPHTTWTIGYLPKGTMPTKEMIDELKNVGKQNKCIFIQLEPNTNRHSREGGNPETTGSSIESRMTMLGLIPSAHPLFTKYTLVLDLTKSEEELLKNMQQKTRYNIKVAQKHEVKIIEATDEKAFEAYWQLMQETTKRQGFYAHTKKYHKTMWDTLNTSVISNEVRDPRPTTKISRYARNDNSQLSAHLFLAKYNDQTLTAWMLFVFKDTLYYPYGSSSREHREVMAQNLMMWEAIKFGKKLGLKKFDMWGSLGENPDTKDPWYGFHRFKMGYSPKLVEFVGSYDLVINPVLYEFYKLADKMRWLFLRLKK